MKRLLITGSTGNTGAIVLSKIRERYPELPILALTRRNTDTAPLEKLNVNWHECDLNDPTTYVDKLDRHDILLEIANLRYAQKLLPVLSSVGVSRAFCITTTGVFSAHHSYSRLYREIESEMRNSDIEITILRPSMIYGNERDKNMHKLIRILKKYPIYPLFGSGNSLMQPVHVEDLANGIVEAVIRDIKGEFNLAGPTALSYIRLIDETYLALHKRSLTISLPVKPVSFAIKLLQNLPGFPIKQEQVIRLQEDKVFNISNARKSLDYQPRPFIEGISQEVDRLKAIKMI